MVPSINLQKILALALFILTAGSLSFAQDGKTIRVKIQPDVTKVLIGARGKFTITEPGSRFALFTGKGRTISISGSRSGIMIGPKSYAGGNVFVASKNNEPIELNGKKYKGSIQLVLRVSGQLSVINCLNLEDYVKGISVRETSHYWPMEALKAQAIVFRSFALYRSNESRNKDYDVTADVSSQVYAGMSAERYRISEAVAETGGQVLVYGGKILPAFYHATCAGHTEDAAALWNIALPPLHGVSCGFCKDSPHFSWKAIIPKKNLIDIWGRSGLRITRITDVVIGGRDASGRVKSLTLVTDATNIVISGSDFRNILGPDIVKSTDFGASVRGDSIVLDGKGWGHGVGLCQWGSYGMAKKGWDYTRILEYYYPGAKIKHETF